MRVLVVGSLPNSGVPAAQRQYRKACIDVGMELAQRGWSISVGTDRPDTADALIVEGARRSRRTIDVDVYYHDEEKPPFLPESEGRASGIRFNYKHGSGNWVSGRIPQIQASDVVLLMGGGDKTAPAFHTARYLRKACLPMPGFGGASGELWSSFVDATDGHLPLHPEEDLRSKIVPWRDTSASALLDFIQRYVALKPYSAMRRSYLFLALAVLACAIAVWAVLFFGQSTPGKYTIFGVLIASSVMGTGLHWFLRVLTRNDTQESSKLIWARAGAAIIEAVALFLLLLVGAISINGDVSFLDSLSNRTDFMRLAAIVSLFGLAAGFMTETISTSLVKRFGKFVEGPTSEDEGTGGAQ
jgi:hypothetical protein